MGQIGAPYPYPISKEKEEGEVYVVLIRPKPTYRPPGFRNEASFGLGAALLETGSVLWGVTTDGGCV